MFHFSLKKRENKKERLSFLSMQIKVGPKLITGNYYDHHLRSFFLILKAQIWMLIM